MSETMLGPIVFTAEVHFVSEDGATTAAATVQFAPGRIPSEEDVLSLVGRAIQATADAGMRLCTPSEFFNRIVVRDATGRVGNFAVPKEFDYDPKELERRALRAEAAKE